LAYLRLIQNIMQNWAETVASALNVDVAVADKNLIRIVGTGDFYNRIDENCPEDSLFAKVIDTGVSKINLIAENEEDCMQCSNFNYCNEHANMSYPIKVDDEIIGVISFASFDSKQANLMTLKKDEYFKMLKQMAEMIEKEIGRIKIINKLKGNFIEVNEIINCLNKGIIILNSQNEITHINAKALSILDTNLLEHKILDRHINTLIKKVKLHDTGNEDMVGSWNIKGKDVRIRYNIKKILLKDNEFSLMISFDEIKEIINIAKTYENKDTIVFSNIIGRSKAILDSINRSKKAALTDSTILIEGESGTGKELFARSIHNESNRKYGPFIVINCGAIPENLIESELFGYEGGTFTGANHSGKKGKVELANDGTLFLDEIGDFPLHMQTRLLRVLQERSVDRVGGDGIPIDVNIRVIAATHRNLEDLVLEGKFRLDLFYRLNVIPIYLPPLRDRDEDIFLCSEYIIERLCRRMNKNPKILSKEVKEAFKDYLWPGNLRELENVLEHCICFSEDDEIKLEDMPSYFFDNKLINAKETTLGNSIFSNNENLSHIEGKTLEDLKKDYEKNVINELIDTYGDTLHGKKIVADKLNISLATLYRKIEAV